MPRDSIKSSLGFEIGLASGEEIASLPGLGIGDQRLDAVQLTFRLQRVAHGGSGFLLLKRQKHGRRAGQQEQGEATQQRPKGAGVNSRYQTICQSNSVAVQPETGNLRPPGADPRN
jgi:hypothetical protein